MCVSIIGITAALDPVPATWAFRWVEGILCRAYTPTMPREQYRAWQDRIFDYGQWKKPRLPDLPDSPTFTPVDRPSGNPRPLPWTTHHDE